MDRDLAKEYLDGIMEKYFKDNGNKEQKMVMVYGLLRKEITMTENGQ